MCFSKILDQITLIFFLFLLSPMAGPRFITPPPSCQSGVRAPPPSRHPAFARRHPRARPAFARHHPRAHPRAASQCGAEAIRTGRISACAPVARRNSIWHASIVVEEVATTPPSLAPAGLSNSPSSAMASAASFAGVEGGEQRQRGGGKKRRTPPRRRGDCRRSHLVSTAAGLNVALRPLLSAHECRAASSGGTEGGTEGKEEPRGERRGAARRLTPELLLRRMRERVRG
jgi:hypothetical protein